MSSNSRQQKRRTRQEHEKKQASNKKSLRGQPETEYGECKKITTFSLTPTGAAGLTKISEGLGISRSELLERIARGLFKPLESSEN